jgi:hypothetical protein
MTASAVGGETVALHCSTTGRSFDVEVVRRGFDLHAAVHVA